MNAFPVHFKLGSLDLDAIVTVSDNMQRYKVEMVTGEPDPILLKKMEDGSWIVEHSGDRRLSPECFQHIGKSIDEYMKQKKT